MKGRRRGGGGGEGSYYLFVNKGEFRRYFFYI